ncbi:DUF4019 domain-containing protein [Hyphobacterium sp.]|uniref:DUF4019 domain-containing protein n=1 Tax=Hyphobacterium sp. TaxID=2004662 RepID=UPI003B526BF4
MKYFLIALLSGSFLLTASPVQAQSNEPASEAEVREAYDVFLDWLNAYQSEDYHQQWQLTDRRIRTWWPRERWTRFMQDSRRHTGELTSIEVLQAGPIEADTLPCTERGHCYRPGVRYVFLMFRTRYSGVEDELTEYAAMAESGDGWRFGGGNILNRPLGETSVIMTRTDESRYRQSFRQ